MIPAAKQDDPLLVPSPGPLGYTLTRLHLRYRKEALADDLVFRTAPPITGGREVYKTGNQLEHGADKRGTNNFQGRYIIRHPWTGPIACDNPRRGIWGGPPEGVEAQKPQAARDLAFAPRGGVQLASLVRENVPEINLLAQSPLDLSPKPAPSAAPSASPTPSASPATPATSTGCGGCTTSGEGAARSSLLLALGALALGWRRRRPC